MVYNKIFMKKLIAIFVFVALLLHTNLKAANNIKIYPVDTMQKFIDTYGKDSLIEFIDEKIDRALVYCYDNWDGFVIDDNTIAFLPVLKHYKYGLDTLPSENKYHALSYYSLYNIPIIDKFEMVKHTSVYKEERGERMPLDFYFNKIGVTEDMYKKQILIHHTAMMSNLFKQEGRCAKIVGDHFLNRFEIYSLNEVLELLYLAIVIREDDYSSVPDLKQKLIDKLNENHMSNSLSVWMENEQVNGLTYDNAFSLYSLMINNYMLYGGIYNLPNQQRDFFYAMNMEVDRSGGYDLGIKDKIKENPHRLTTLYVIWLMSQWKDYLKSMP